MSLMSIEPPMPNQNRVTDTSAQLLSLTRAELSVDASGGLARVRLVQEFANPHSEPLSVTYKLPLPADAAVGGFAFVIGDRRIVGHIDGRKEARETFERAIIEGKSAALLEQDRSSFFTQEIGNIPPGATVRAEIDIDQPLLWLSEGSWEWRFPLAAAPRYLGSHAVEGDVGITTATGDIGARASLSMTIRDLIAEGRSPESPSHPLVTNRVAGSFKVELGSGNRAELDRDVVLRWPAAGSAPVAAIDVARPGVAALNGSAFGLLTIVPPAPDARVAKVARDLTLLIDTSGSMSGEPLAQAKRIACALVDSLETGDQLEMIEFSYTSTSFEPHPRPIDAALKKRAIAWIHGLEASGGTEMLSGVQHAMRELRPGSQRQVILITDGLVGFEREIVMTLLAQLPKSARLHAVGVGSAVNRSLLAPIARAGRGIEAIVGLGEDPERAAIRILSRTVAPAVVDLVVEGSAVRKVVPSAGLSDAYAGSPLRAAVELDPAGGELIVRGRTAEGAFVRSLRVVPTNPGEGSEAVVKLYGRELVEDLEMRLSAGEPASTIDPAIEDTGKRFAILTRHTSWVATTPEATVDPRDATRKLVQPQALPYGMRAQSPARHYAASAAAAPMGLAMPG
ncbi:MAG: VWA domain-containing protein, partial [Myxococcales bacterium]|nr:VWA domain-containing protein [Myxococcales bacterium]